VALAVVDPGFRELALRRAVIIAWSQKSPVLITKIVTNTGLFMTDVETNAG
jgi:hypothetical protein